MTGRIVQISGSVIDVKFEQGQLPAIKEALKVKTEEGVRVMEVAQHIGRDMVRCIMLASSDGMSKGMEVERTEGSIRVPVGPKVLGRMKELWSYLMNSFEEPQVVWRKIKKINALKEYEEAVEAVFREQGLVRSEE